jgi:hypothetical protein
MMRTAVKVIWSRPSFTRRRAVRASLAPQKWIRHGGGHWLSTLALNHAAQDVAREQHLLLTVRALSKQEGVGGGGIAASTVGPRHAM